MTSPRTLIVSIAATACGFILALVAVIGQASGSATLVVESALAPSTVLIVAQELSHDESVRYAVAIEPANSR